MSGPGAPDRVDEPNDQPPDGMGGTAGVAPEPERPAPSAAFACSDGAGAGPSTPLRRLTGEQLRNTYRDLVTWALPARDAEEVLQAAERPLAMIAEDLRPKIAVAHHGTFRRVSQSITQNFVDSALDAAVALATHMVAGDRLGRSWGACAADADGSNDAACARAFVARFGERALRRPLTDEDVKSYTTLLGGGAITRSSAILVMTALMSSPRALYLVESGTSPVSGHPDSYALDDFEIASRLSYHLWDTAPDDALFEAARAGVLHERTTLEQQVARMLRDPRGAASIRTFFAEWLRLDQVGDPYPLRNEAAFKAFAGDLVPDEALRRAMADEVLEIVGHVRNGGDGGRLDDLLLTDAAFPASNSLAQIYGLPRWEGGEPRRFEARERPGVLTRAAFLVRAQVAGRSNPIMKGVLIRRDILCDSIPDPPPNAAMSGGEANLDELRTERDVATVVTESSATCAACHKTLINPLGFATEGFDALGRRRDTERRFDASTGALRSEAKVDTRVVPRIWSDDDAAVDGPADLMDRIAQSGKVSACAARQYFRYTFARAEDDVADGCTLESLRLAAQSQSLDEFLRSVLLSPAFLERRIPMEATNPTSGGDR